MDKGATREREREREMMMMAGYWQWQYSRRGMLSKEARVLR